MFKTGITMYYEKFRGLEFRCDLIPGFRFPSHKEEASYFPLLLQESRVYSSEK